MIHTIAEWLTAIGTIGAVIVALFLAGIDGRRRNKEERRRQAEQVTGWLEYSGNSADAEMFVGVVVRNGSNSLVYDLIASLVSLQGAFRETAVGSNFEDYRYRALVGQVPPGETKTRIQYGGGGMHLRFGIELAYQDAAGRYWLRRGNGLLEEVKKHPLDLYGIGRPVGWEK